MIRVVLDTNILISALLSPNGAPAQIFLMVLANPEMQLCVSAEIFAEYEDVVSRPRFKRDEDEIAATLRTIREKSLWVRSLKKICVCTDPDDDMFLECAESANANYLITGNTRHFPAKWSGTEIVTARHFLGSLV